MKTQFCTIATAALLCGCHKPSPAPSAALPEPVRWEYAQFQFHPANFNWGPNYSEICYLKYYEPLTDRIIRSNLCYSVDEVLNGVGDFGWELAWTDGTNFIVKRKSNEWLGYTNGNGVINVSDTFIPRLH